MLTVLMGMMYADVYRSLAFLKGLRYSEALQDADAAVAINEKWPKAHWRRGAALKELKNVPKAVLAFYRAWDLSKGAACLPRSLYRSLFAGKDLKTQ